MAGVKKESWAKCDKKHKMLHCVCLRGGVVGWAGGGGGGVRSDGC